MISAHLAFVKFRTWFIFTDAFFKVSIAIFSTHVSLGLTIWKIPTLEGTIVSHDQATQWMAERKTYSIKMKTEVDLWAYYSCIYNLSQCAWITDIINLEPFILDNNRYSGLEIMLVIYIYSVWVSWARPSQNNLVGFGNVVLFSVVEWRQKCVTFAKTRNLLVMMWLWTLAVKPETGFKSFPSTNTKSIPIAAIFCIYRSLTGKSSCFAYLDIRKEYLRPLIFLALYFFFPFESIFLTRVIVVAKITQSKVVHQYSPQEMVWCHVKVIYWSFFHMAENTEGNHGTDWATYT